MLRCRLSQFEIASTGNCVNLEKFDAKETVELRAIAGISRIEGIKFRRLVFQMATESVAMPKENKYPREESQIDTIWRMCSRSAD